MPPRWPREPDRSDPAFRKVEDLINFVVHVAFFSAINSGLWFFQTLSPRWSHLPWVTLVWLVGLAGHALYIFVIADYAGVDESYDS